MVNTQQENLTTEVYLKYLANTVDMSTAERAAWFYETRVGNRKDASSLGWLNSLLRTGMVGIDHINNAMYCDLLGGQLTHEEWGKFLREYYWGSGYGFQRIVLPAAVKGSGNDIWRAYIKSIIHEENTPESHCGLFKSFIESLGFEIADMPESSDVFNKKMLEGYTGSLGHSLGYALAIETEADFQVALIFAALRAHYEQHVENTSFFHIHMSEYGEELHAQETCRAIEQLLKQGLCTQSEIEQGFQRAIIDTRDYMRAIRASVRSCSEAELV
jgi:hypothetical protein